MSDASKRRESLRPKRHSGVPVRYARIIIWPDTSARSAVPGCQRSSVYGQPVADINRLTFSITSTNASFRRYFMSLLRYDITPVACVVILEESSL